MKRIRIALIILLVAVALGVLLWKNRNHTGTVGINDFAISRPAQIDKVFFAPNDKSLTWLQLEKDPQGIWWVKNQQHRYKADTTAVKDLLYYVMAKIQVKNPVNDGSLAGVNRELALKGVKTQFYANGKLIKSLYAGGPTPDFLGTFMYLPNEGNDKTHERPCIVVVPGHNGYVTPYFNTDINAWRTPALIDIPSDAIQSVSVNWTGLPGESFSITNIPDAPVLKNKEGTVIPADKNRLLAYLDMFTWITREGGEIAGINRNDTAKKALLASTPFFSLTIKEKSGQSTTLHLYYRPISEESYSPETRTGKLKINETETYWGVLGGTDEIWVVQDAIVKNRMRHLSEFLSK